MSASGSLTFSPGELSKSFIVQVKGDRALEDYESFYAQLGTPTNATVGVSMQQIRIRNDEKSSIIMNNCIPVLEGNACNFKPHLSDRYFQSIEGLANTHGASAFAPGDFVAVVNQSVTFPAGSVAWLNVPVSTNLDGIAEAAQVFILTVATAGTLPAASRFAVIAANTT